MLKTCINQNTLRPLKTEDFLKVAHKAGFEAVELFRDSTFDYLKSHSEGDLKKLIDDYGLKVTTFNAIELFSLCPENEFKGMMDYTERLMKIGNKIGCDTIIAVPSFVENAIVPPEKFFDTTITRFHLLRTLANQYQFRMAFEPLGFVNNSVRKIDDAMKIIKAADQDGFEPSGLVIDTFHFFLGENSLKDLKQIPGDRLWLLHFNDCIRKPLTELHDRDRVYPGLGYYDLKGFIAAAKETGYEGYLSIELFNEEYYKQDPQRVANECIKRMKPFL
jgi:2-keto-myo-inositol isomerase